MRWARNDAVLWEEFDGEALLVNPRDGSRWKINAAAMRVWELSDGSLGVAELASALKSSRECLQNFCQQFEGLGLLRACAVGNGPMVLCSQASNTPFQFQRLGLGNGPRRRPSPRGNSGPGG